MMLIIPFCVMMLIIPFSVMMLIIPSPSHFPQCSRTVKGNTVPSPQPKIITNIKLTVRWQDTKLVRWQHTKLMSLQAHKANVQMAGTHN